MNNSTDRKALRGFMTALVTPFSRGEIDWPALESLIDRQIHARVDWIVPCGTTGETPTLSSIERTKIIETTVERALGKCSVMAGTGANSTSTTIQLTKDAARLGADAALVVTPYYNRPSQEGLFRHFAAIAEAVDIPLVLYNVPARTGCDLQNDTIIRLREKFPNIAAIKDASGGLTRVTDLLTRSDIAVLCGDDALTLPMMTCGAVGVISVIGNIAPELMRSLVDASFEGNSQSALQLHRRVYDFATGIGAHGPNPVPIKTAMAIAGLIEEEFRLPLCPLDNESRGEIEQRLRRHEFATEATHDHASH
jgi:4-hydroxy-tetrahydrodipicolinate synthase